MEEENLTRRIAAPELCAMSVGAWGQRCATCTPITLLNVTMSSEMAQVIRIKQMSELSLSEVEGMYRHERRSNVKAALRLPYIAMKADSNTKSS